MNPQELTLRDIHLPEPVSWWPPAPGWWLVAAALCGLAALLYWWRVRTIRRRNAPPAIAERELARIQMQWNEHNDMQRLLRDISILLRRAGMSLTSRRQAASLTGAAWQQYLDELAGEAIFSPADARLLTEASYQRSLPKGSHTEAEHLIELSQRWIDAVAKRVSRK